MLLCQLLNGLNDEQTSTIVYNGCNKQARKLADWWERHQKLDKEREEMEDKFLEEKKNLIKELTPRQRHLLGIE